MAQRAAARQRNGSRLEPRALERQQRQQEPGWCWSSRPAPQPAGELGRSLPAITEQLWHEAAAPGGPGAALLRAGRAQPICCRDAGLRRVAGAIPGERAGCAGIPPQPLPAKCCNSSAVIPAWCCDTDARREIQAPASSHSRGCCSSLRAPGAAPEVRSVPGPGCLSLGWMSVKTLLGERSFDLLSSSGAAGIPQRMGNCAELEQRLGPGTELSSAINAPALVPRESIPDFSVG